MAANEITIPSKRVEYFMAGWCTCPSNFGRMGERRHPFNTYSARQTSLPDMIREAELCVFREMADAGKISRGADCECVVTHVYRHEHYEDVQIPDVYYHKHYHEK